MSLDIINGSVQSKDFPYTIYLASGSQALNDENKVYLMKWSELFKTKNDDEEDSSLDGISSNDEEEGLEAKLEFAEFYHSGVVNRIRCNNDFGVLAT